MGTDEFARDRATVEAAETFDMRRAVDMPAGSAFGEAVAWWYVASTDGTPQVLCRDEESALLYAEARARWSAALAEIERLTARVAELESDLSGLWQSYTELADVHAAVTPTEAETADLRAAAGLLKTSQGALAQRCSETINRLLTFHATAWNPMDCPSSLGDVWVGETKPEPGDLTTFATHDATVHERDQARAELAAMRPVAEAAEPVADLVMERVARTGLQQSDAEHRLYAVVDAYRAATATATRGAK